MAARQAAEERAQRIIDNAWAEALDTLKRHKDAHSALVEALLERETVEGAEIQAIVASFQSTAAAE
jgi:ATP-dependent Zn protease